MNIELHPLKNPNPARGDIAVEFLSQVVTVLKVQILRVMPEYLAAEHQKFRKREITLGIVYPP